MQQINKIDNKLTKKGSKSTSNTKQSDKSANWKEFNPSKDVNYINFTSVTNKCNDQVFLVIKHQTWKDPKIEKFTTIAPEMKEDSVT